MIKSKRTTDDCLYSKTVPGLISLRRDMSASTMVNIIMVAAALLIHMDINQVGNIRPNISLKQDMHANSVTFNPQKMYYS